MRCEDQLGQPPVGLGVTEPGAALEWGKGFPSRYFRCWGFCLIFFFFLRLRTEVRPEVESQVQKNSQAPREGLRNLAGFFAYHHS